MKIKCNLFFIVMCLLFHLSSMAQKENLTLKIEEYDLATFYLILPATIGDELFNSIKDECNDTAITFYLKLSLSKDTSVVPDSVWLKCGYVKETFNNLSKAFKQMEFKVEGISFIKISKFTFIVPITYRRKV